ncbi:hypothetical protein E9993_17425 [Labilibacter sediminis]|nr:hypothetical protein E9993_17425 [Labilibacter sediminis]
MEINDLLRDEFMNEWRRLSNRSASDSLGLIREEFRIQDVENSINESMRTFSYSEKQTRERYHKQNLRELTRTFAQALYRTSDNGSLVNSRTIMEAKRSMKSRGDCDIYPC